MRRLNFLVSYPIALRVHRHQFSLGSGNPGCADYLCGDDIETTAIKYLDARQFSVAGASMFESDIDNQQIELVYTQAPAAVGAAFLLAVLVTLGLLFMLFAGVLLMIARNYNSSIMQSLQLREENNDLLQKTAAINVALEHEARSRQHAQNQLLRERQLFTEGPVTIFVENDGILEKLAEIGVDYAQGYGIARPRPLHEMQLVSKRSA